VPQEARKPQPETTRVETVGAARPAGDAARRLRSRKRWLRPLLLVLGPLVVLVGAGYVYATGGRYVSTDNAYVHADKVAVSAEVAGRIAETAVHENQPVAEGAVLFRLDDRPYRVALDRAEAQLRAARDAVEALKATWRQKAAEIQMAQMNESFAQRDLSRQTQLARNSYATQAKLDEARHAVDVARQQIAMTRHEQNQIAAQLGGGPDTPLDAVPSYEAAKAARDQAALDLAHTVVRAPFAGIASKTPEPGAYVAPGVPVMSVVGDTGLWIDANFKETDLTHVRTGQPVSITIDTYPDRIWHGTVKSIAPASGAEFSVLPPQNATGNWVKVVQRIPVRVTVAHEPDAPQLRAGMSAVVDIDTNHQRALPRFVRTALGWIEGDPAQAHGVR
jgi:membrane fusion protein, multidrug efflux system